MLPDIWDRGVLGKLTWSKHKGTTGKLDPSPQCLAEEKFFFRRTYQHWFLNTIFPNFDHQNRSNSRHMLIQGNARSAKGLKNIPIK